MNTESCTIDKKNGRFDPVFNRVFTFVTAFSWLLQSSEPQRSPLFYCPNHRPAAINNGIETLFHEAFPLGCALLLFFFKLFLSFFVVRPTGPVGGFGGGGGGGGGVACADPSPAIDRRNAAAIKFNYGRVTRCPAHAHFIGHQGRCHGS